MFVGVKYEPRKLIVLLRSLCTTLMEHAMMVDETAPTKKRIFEILDDIFRCDSYKQSAELRYVCLIKYLKQPYS